MEKKILDDTGLARVADYVNGKEKLIFKGTSAEWEALTAEEQAKYSVRYFTDNETETNTVVDAVTDGNMHPVTSNAVYDALLNKQSDLLIQEQYINGTNGGDWALSDNKLYETSYNITVPTGYKLLFCIISTAWTNSHAYYGECYCPGFTRSTSGKLSATCANAPSAGSIVVRGLCVFAKL